MVLNRYIRQTALITSITVMTCIATDTGLTYFLRTRGFSQFFETSKEAGFINKKNFSGVFGGPLDDFSAHVDIDEIGTRKVSASNCISETSQRRRIIFVGDSMVAGFEVENDQTYTSVFSQLNCEIQVINGGVRAHDTHMAIANALRISKEIEPADNDAASTVVYMATSNDFLENDNKNAYQSMKSKFGSFYDGEYNAPAKSQWINNVRMFIGDNMYFTTKAISRFRTLEAIQQKNQEAGEALERDDCLARSDRALEIYRSSIPKAIEKGNNMFYIGVHPMTVNFERSEQFENCLQEAIKQKGLGQQIKLISIHKFMRDSNPGFINNPENRFRRDGHYSTNGHKNIAHALNSMPELTLRKN